MDLESVKLLTERLEKKLSLVLTNASTFFSIFNLGLYCLTIFLYRLVPTIIEYLELFML